LGNIFYPLWIKRIVTGMVSYGRSKRANILFAHEIHHRFSHTGISSVASHPGIASTDIWHNGAKIFPTIVSNFLKNNVWISQSSDQGAATQVWAALDDDSVPSGSYVGPRWWFKGSPVWLGPIIRSIANNDDDDASQGRLTTRGVYQPLPHFWPFSRNEGTRLWEQSLQALGIEEFGK
jgi:NAD(P)-dependent dehydrogenase (short-subunit alcohol dehydrogenase family)